MTGQYQMSDQYAALCPALTVGKKGGTLLVVHPFKGPESNFRVIAGI